MAKLVWLNGNVQELDNAVVPPRTTHTSTATAFSRAFASTIGRFLSSTSIYVDSTMAFDISASKCTSLKMSFETSSWTCANKLN